jgi:hypothetical protein
MLLCYDHGVASNVPSILDGYGSTKINIRSTRDRSSLLKRNEEVNRDEHE